MKTGIYHLFYIPLNLIHCYAHCQNSKKCSIYNFKTVIDSNKIPTDLRKGAVYAKDVNFLSSINSDLLKKLKIKKFNTCILEINIF